MRFSMNWISDFVDLSGLDIDKLIHRFTLSTAEVDEVFHFGDDIRSVVSGKILSVNDHPDSKKLHLLKVCVGGDRTVECVCGAKNVREGLIVPFAMAGGCVCGAEIGEAIIAGYKSGGMCCSAAELGISPDNSGLMELPYGTPVGVDITELFKIRDTVFEVDNKSLTNRPDLWGHYGVAREFAALCGRELKPPKIYDLSQFDNLPNVQIDIADRQNTLRYSSIAAENISVKKSPIDMMIRLHYCGLRPINLLADLTNYIMLELGQPMHAFDHSLVRGIEVKRFDKPFEFKTLDAQDRHISTDMLMICSGGKPCAIAGVMGGIDSEIRDDTSSVLLESATFDGVCIRKTSSALSLRTDASMRYEKMLDPELTYTALARYIFLLKGIDSGVKISSSFTDVSIRNYPEKEILFDKAYIDRYTGIDISEDEIVHTLTMLGFSVKRNGDGSFSAIAPSWRRTKDITIKADIVEEITRIYGYDNFAVHAPTSALRPALRQKSLDNISLCTDLLAHKYGLHEVHSYIWCDAKKYRELAIPLPTNPKLLCPPSPEHAVLRSSIVPTLLGFLNDNRGFADDYGIFEAGRTVSGVDGEGKCCERQTLAITIFSKTLSEKELYFKIRDIFSEIIRLCANCGTDFCKTDKFAEQWRHPVNTADVSAMGEKLGYIGVVTPAVSGNIDKKAAIVCGELDIKRLSALDTLPVKFNEPSKFPAIDVDFSFITDVQTPYSALYNAIAERPFEYLRGIRLVDCYCDKNAAHGRKTFTIRLNFGSDDRTLSRDEIKGFTDMLVQNLANVGFNLCANS